MMLVIMSFSSACKMPSSWPTVTKVRSSSSLKVGAFGVTGAPINPKSRCDSFSKSLARGLNIKYRMFNVGDQVRAMR